MKNLEVLKTAGLYIHIPFCDIKCSYCDFYTVTKRDSQIPSYLKALKKEVEIYSTDPIVKNLRFETIFLGGGTPSLLSPAQIFSLLELIKTRFAVATNPEVTLETNPNTVDLQKLEALLESGVTRLSLGVQSFYPEELKFLDRDHSDKESVAAVQNARKAGFENISIDLIFGLPKQKLFTWQKNLELAVEINPNHISVYNLTYEEGTLLTTRLKRKEIEILPDETQKQMFLTTIDFLQANGFEQYEISNYAKQGFQSIHNKKYWNGSPYLGLGVSSHSFLNSRRFWNVRNMKTYISALENEALPIEGGEKLDMKQRALEKVFLGLRQRRGIDLKSFEDEIGLTFFERYPGSMSKFFEVDFRNAKITSELVSGVRSLRGMFLEIEGGFLRLTKEGIILSDSICAEFV